VGTRVQRRARLGAAPSFPFFFFSPLPFFFTPSLTVTLFTTQYEPSPRRRVPSPHDVFFPPFSFSCDGPRSSSRSKLADGRRNGSLPLFFSFFPFLLYEFSLFFPPFSTLAARKERVARSHGTVQGSFFPSLFLLCRFLFFLFLPSRNRAALWGEMHVLRDLFSFPLNLTPFLPPPPFCSWDGKKAELTPFPFFSFFAEFFPPPPSRSRTVGWVKGIPPGCPFFLLGFFLLTRCDTKANASHPSFFSFFFFFPFRAPTRGRRRRVFLFSPFFFPPKLFFPPPPSRARRFKGTKPHFPLPLPPPPPFSPDRPRCRRSDRRALAFFFPPPSLSVFFPFFQIEGRRLPFSFFSFFFSFFFLPDGSRRGPFLFFSPMFLLSSAADFRKKQGKRERGVFSSFFFFFFLVFSFPEEPRERAGGSSSFSQFLFFFSPPFFRGRQVVVRARPKELGGHPFLFFFFFFSLFPPFFPLSAVGGAEGHD